MHIDSKTYERIRYLHEREQMSQRAIAKQLSISRKSVKKYLDGTSVPWQRKEGTGKSGVLTDDHRSFIIACLREDQIENLPKQFHTARRIFHRLQDEKGFTGSETTVRRAVAIAREGIKKTKVFVPLSYEPGEAVQIDWGEAYVYVNGARIVLQYFCMRECYSGDIFVKAFYRQNKESFLEGLLCGFEHFGGIPARVIFDNAKVAVQEGFGHFAKTQEYYANFAAHYCFKPVFCNIASGNEKGLVENLVGYIRKNVLVPLPRVKHIDQLNQKFLEYCLKYRREHKIESKASPVSLLILESRKVFSPFPPYRFDTSNTKTASSDEYSLITFDRHKYSIPVQYAGKTVTVKAYGNKLDILFSTQLIASHTRLYGEEMKIAYDLEHYLPLLEQRPSSVYNAKPVKASLPVRLHKFILKLDDPKKFVPVIRLYLDDPDRLMDMLDSGATYEALEPLLKPGSPTASKRKNNSADKGASVCPHLSPEQDIKVAPVTLDGYDALLHR